MSDPMFVQRPRIPVLEEEEGGGDEGDGNWIMSYADMMTLLAVFFIMMLSFASVDAGKLEDVKKSAVQYFGGVYEVPFEKTVEKMKALIKEQNLSDQVTITADALGVTTTFHGAIFFESGKAELMPAAVDLLGKMSEVIKKEASGFKILVEGHTDDVPIQSSHFPSNWELSGARASRVIRLFETIGFPKNNLTAIGYGDTRPIFPNRDEQGAPIVKNQSQNRRVVIKILK